MSRPKKRIRSKTVCPTCGSNRTHNCSPQAFSENCDGLFFVFGMLGFLVSPYLIFILVPSMYQFVVAMFQNYYQPILDVISMLGIGWGGSVLSASYTNVIARRKFIVAWICIFLSAFIYISIHIKPLSQTVSSSYARQKPQQYLLEYRRRIYGHYNYLANGLCCLLALSSQRIKVVAERIFASYWKFLRMGV